MKFNFTLLALLLISTAAFAQKQYDNWYFGYGNALSFVTGAPVVTTPSMCLTNEGSASISNANGDLLFYTDGRTVYTRFHTVMDNGTGLNGAFSSSQSALIIPDPADTNSYYIFTTDEFGMADGLCYSKVDMTLFSGEGGVTIKNVQLLTPVHEKLAAVKHANGTDYWVVTHDLVNNSTAYYAFPVTATGVGNPVVSSVGLQNTGSEPFIGYMRLSPDGSKLVNALRRLNKTEICDFDIATGIVSNPFQFDSGTNIWIYSMEFSATGDFLYLATADIPSTLFQLNMNAGNPAAIIASATVISSSTLEGGCLQLASDNKIYYAHHNSNVIGAINNPDSPGVACNYIDTAITVIGFMAYGLQNSISGINQVTGIKVPGHVDYNLSIYPNPVSDALNIYTNISEHLEIKIYDIASKCLITYDFTGQASIMIDNISEGIYFYEVRNQSNVIKKGKLVKL